MTRKKKSRKPGLAKIGSSKKDKALLEQAKDKKPKKKTGKAPGNRQQEALAKKKTHTTDNSKKDPRIGSKKPIVLVKDNPEKSAKVKTNKQTKPSIAKIKVIDQAPTIAQQLAAIEADEGLQLILAKQEHDEALTEQEVNYYNDLMEQYDVLAEQLAPEQLTQQQDSAEPIDEEALWDKLDNTDFSSFEEE